MRYISIISPAETFCNFYPLKRKAYGQCNLLSATFGEKEFSQPIHRLLRRKHIPDIKIIHQHPLGCLPVHALADGNLSANTACSSRRIRLRVSGAVGDDDAEDGDVEEVVYDVHAAGRGGVGGAVEGALGEVGV